VHRVYISIYTDEVQCIYSCKEVRGHRVDIQFHEKCSQNGVDKYVDRDKGSK